MKKLFVVLSVVVLAVTAILLAQNYSKLPKGWFSAGSKPTEYEMGIDKSVFQNGNSSAFIKSKEPKNNEFGTLMQYISAENFIGKRLQLTGYIKSESVEGWSGMWMRLDGETNQSLGFDNMQNRSIRGTTAWKKYEIVLDVPAGSKAIAYGVLLSGKGKIWFDNMKIEEVDKSIPVTNMTRENNLPKQPVNLDFED
ncbi:MAG: hypothetical protein NTX65_15890 [Ignavibacteriales bacterium]|nr:hypothetical protein [Ignavibacteriales bacterium]